MGGREEGGLGWQGRELSPLEADKLAEALQALSVTPPLRPFSSSTSLFPAASAATATAATATDEKRSINSSNKMRETAAEVGATGAGTTTK